MEKDKIEKSAVLVVIVAVLMILVFDVVVDCLVLLLWFRLLFIL